MAGKFGLLYEFFSSIIIADAPMAVHHKKIKTRRKTGLLRTKKRPREVIRGNIPVSNGGHQNRIWRGPARASIVVCPGAGPRGHYLIMRDVCQVLKKM